ncbi:hypothetical protein niasHT_005925 [Heterodera trifolii]|uniref:Uncharacterized protein n=1 Tax=Heterodera trifolii TaxID=157864 RepID=A0ABD2LT58_9BILA
MVRGLLTDIWAAKSGDVALTFVNASLKKDCENKEFIISGQAFAIPKDQVKRDELVGIVYSSQLAAQLTALSAKVSANTQKLFIETVRKICTSLQFLVYHAAKIKDQKPSITTATMTV